MNIDIQNYQVFKTENGYRIQAIKEGNHKAYWSCSADGFSSDNFAGDFQQELEVSDFAPGHRMYFHILNDNIYTVVSTRTIAVEGMFNVRELGGYNTEDGKSFVKPGVIFRSGHLGKLKDDGAKVLEDIGVKYVLDFRAENETVDLEDRPLSKATMNIIPAINFREGDASAGNSRFVLREFLSAPIEQRLKSKTDLMRHYREMPFDNLAYKDLFCRMLNDEAPVLFHCAAGKDRTGVAALLILLVLGVSVDTAIYDYMLTASVYKQRMEELKEKNKDLFKSEVDYEIFDEVMTVRENNIRLTIREIFERYPDIETFANENLDLSYDDIKILRDKFLLSHTP